MLKRLRNAHPVLFCILVEVLFLGSLFGFGDLIGVVYPIFGYCSSVFIVLMAVHYFKVKKQNAQKA